MSNQNETKTTVETVKPLDSKINLLTEDNAGGCCGGGACHV